MRLNLRFSKGLLGLLLLLMLLVLKYLDVHYKFLLDHDESISVLAATGHQTLWAQQILDPVSQQWQPAPYWQRMVQSEPSANWPEIQAGLNHYDIHPPLYFWLLGSWLSMIGEHKALTYVFNLSLLLISLGLFYRLLRLHFTKTAAFTLTAMFMFTPAVAGPYLVLRQYELVLLIALAILWLLSRFAVNSEKSHALRWWHCGLLAALATAGLLTQVQFVWVLLAATVAIACTNLAWKHKLFVATALASSGLWFLLVNYEFFTALERFSQQLQQRSLLEFIYRLKGIATTMGDLVGLSPFAAALVFVALLAWSCRYLWQQRASRDRNTLLWFWLCFCVVIIIGQFGQYLFMASPRHAVGGRYYLLIAPCVTLMIGLWFYQQSKDHRWLWAYVAVLFCTSSYAVLQQVLPRLQTDKVLLQQLNIAPKVLLNNSARGFALPLLQHVSANAAVLVLRKGSEFAEFAQHVPNLSVHDLIVLQEGNGVTAAMLEQQLSYLQQHVLLKKLHAERGVYQVIAKRPDETSCRQLKATLAVP